MNDAGPIMAAYWGETHINPIAGAGLLVTLVAVYAVSRRSVPCVLLPMLVLVAGGQRLAIGGVDFGILRLLGLFAISRFAIRAEFRDVKWSVVDLAALLVGGLPFICALARGESHNLMMNLGMGFDFVSMFLVGRVCLTDDVAWTRFAVTMAILSLPISMAFAFEKMTARNLFAAFGGVPEITKMRFGKLRAQGAFAHPIMAGAWFSAFTVLFVGVLRSSRSTRLRCAMIVGILCSVVISLSVDSATAVAGLMLAGVLSVVYWWPRICSYWRFGVFFALVIHFVSQGGLHGLLFTRFSIVSGSTGYHRYRLYDAAMDRVSEWFLLGTRGTDHWGWHLFDVTSEYILSAVKGGMLGLACLVILQLRPVYVLGVSRRKMTSSMSVLGFHIAAAVFLQAFMMLSVSYFGQAIFLLAVLPAGAMSFAAANCRKQARGQVVASGKCCGEGASSDPPLVEWPAGGVGAAFENR